MAKNFLAHSKMPRVRAIFFMCPASIWSCLGNVGYVRPFQRIIRKCVFKSIVCPGAHSFSIRSTAASETIYAALASCGPEM